MLLCAAFSPVLIDQVAHLAERPWAAYCVVFLPLFVGALRRSPHGRPRPGAGWLVLLAALALELVLVRGGLTRAARPSLALAALGLGFLQGRPDLRTSVLLLWFVPVPHALVSAASPSLEAVLAGAAAFLLRVGGLPALVETNRYEATLFTGGGSLPLIDADGGLPVAALLIGLAWVAGGRRGWSIPRTLVRGLLCACLAFPLQIVALLVGGALAGRVDPSALRVGLDVGPWALATLVALLGPLRPARSGPTPAGEPLSSAAP